MGQLVRPDRVTTVRLSAELGDDVDAIARIDEVTFSDVVRSALALYIAQRTADAEFRHRLVQRINADQAILRRLAAPTDPAPTAADAAEEASDG